jgi:hypothetical protein
MAVFSEHITGITQSAGGDIAFVQIQPNESHRSPRDDPVKLCRFLTDRDSTSDDFQLHIVVLEGVRAAQLHTRRNLKAGIQRLRGVRSTATDHPSASKNA